MHFDLLILEKLSLKVTYQKQMENFTREHQRYYIFVEWKNGTSAADIHQKLVVAEGVKALHLSTIYCWIEAFEHGQQSIKDEACSGQPCEAVTPTTIAMVEQFVNEDCHITTQNLAEEVGISKERISHILHEELGMRKHVSCFTTTMLHHIPQKQLPST